MYPGHCHSYRPQADAKPVIGEWEGGVVGFGRIRNALSEEVTVRLKQEDVRGTPWEKDIEMSGGKHAVYVLSNQIHSMLQEQCKDSEASHVHTGEDPEVQSGMTLILAAMRSHWKLLVFPCVSFHLDAEKRKLKWEGAVQSHIILRCSHDRHWASGGKMNHHRRPGGAPFAPGSGPPRAGLSPEHPAAGTAGPG